MRDRPVPVDDDIATLARWVLYGVVLLPTAAALAVGISLKLIGRLVGAQQDSPLSGLLTGILFVAVIQVAVVVVGLTHYLSGVKLHGEAPATLAKAEPGIFYHD